MPALYRAADKRRQSPNDATLSSRESYRSAFRRDSARLVHSSAFRRLQGKTQLFPSHESDFFRNRLTHSLEVAQIAKTIAAMVNEREPRLKGRNNQIDLDLVEFAALAHDIGHPPFGHNGEEALDECMWDSGGFEGNAQTLRILAKLEKRSTLIGGVDNPVTVDDEGRDCRAGLNLASRSLAAVLKYDNEIPRLKHDRGAGANSPVKGYYYTESALVNTIKKNVGADKGKFRTIECSIMDTADDIAYSTYDLEDAFKARFLTPVSIISFDEGKAQKVCETIRERADRYYPDLKSADREFEVRDFYTTVLTIFNSILPLIGEDTLSAAASDENLRTPLMANILSEAADASENLAANGYYRTRFTSELIKRAMGGIEVSHNDRNPALSVVRLKIETFFEVETLKNLCYQSLIMSPMLKLTEYRGKEIVNSIFKAIKREGGHLLMPDDFQDLYRHLREPHEKDRVICDFIAGMTNRYAIEFYNRLFGTTSASIYSPV
jgi:dGTPase